MDWFVPLAARVIFVDLFSLFLFKNGIFESPSFIFNRAWIAQKLLNSCTKKYI
jgi:hypothetical protein